MFPLNDNDWITYIQAAIPNNENPCWIDIVGDAQYPAAYYYLYPIPDPNPTDVAFRMRLNGDPLSNNPNEYRLKKFVWGVQIEDTTNAVLFTILINASGNTYRLQVKNQLSIIIYDVPISLSNPFQPADNVKVVDAGVHFPCASPMIPDEDFFVDFTLPTGIFGSFNFTTSSYRLCYFTSTQANVINKDNICGMVINPPIETPVLCVTKQIVSGPSALCTNEMNSWLLVITIFNCGTIPVEDVIMTDTLNSNITLTSPPIFIPSANVDYDSGTRIVTWDVGTIDTGDTVAITINITGYFTNPGHYILDAGIVNGIDLTPVNFADHGILVYTHGQLTADKQIISGPLSIERCKISSWTLSIVVTNNNETDMPNVVITDRISDSFTVESGPYLTPSIGFASFSGNEIVWEIDDLAGNSSETLLITVTGFFSSEGHIIFNTGSFLDQCMQTVTFQDTGIDVLPILITKKINVSGDILDCKTNELLDGVSATVYDNNCKVIGTYTFDQQYEFNLSSGTYSVLFEKEGYNRKFLSLVLLSDIDINANVNMPPKSTVISTVPVNEGNEDLDLYSSIICEKIDAEIVYSSTICINSEAQVETVDDVVDSFFCNVVCNSKLRLVVNLEKNLVYKLNQVKDLIYNTKAVYICYPLRQNDNCTNKKCYFQVKRVFHCREQNLVYNVAYAQFIAYLLNENDIIINDTGTAQEKC